MHWRNASDVPSDGSRVAPPPGMRNLPLTAAIVLAACGPETTTFRTTDTGDPARATAALHNVTEGLRVDVWSNGGYIGASEEPMTHIGFELQNTGQVPVIFDSEALTLNVLDKNGAALPAARFVAVTPLGPAKITVGAGDTTALDAYFLIPVRPRVISSMQVRWLVRAGDRALPQVSSFVRDDDYPVVDPPVRPNM